MYSMLLALSLAASPVQAATPDPSNPIVELALMKYAMVEAELTTAELSAYQSFYFEKLKQYAARYGMTLAEAASVVGRVASVVAATGVSVLGAILPGGGDPDVINDLLNGGDGTSGRTDMTDTTNGRSGDTWGDLPGWLSDSGSGTGVMDNSTGQNNDDPNEDLDDTTLNEGTNQNGAGDYGTDDLRDGSLADDSWYTEEGGEEDYPDEDEGGDGDDGYNPNEDGDGDGWLISMSGDRPSVFLWDIAHVNGMSGCLAQSFYVSEKGDLRFSSGWANMPCSEALDASR